MIITDFFSKSSQGLGFAEFLNWHTCFAVGMNSHKLLGGSNATDVNEENKLSLKRRSVDEATLNNCEEEEEPEMDCSNWGSNGGSTVNVYTKRQKTIPMTPPLRLVFRRQEASPPPGFEYVREVESPTASDLVVEFDDEVLDGQPPSPIITEDDRYSLPLCSLCSVVLFFFVLLP